MATESNLENQLWADHEAQVRNAKPHFEALIEEVTGWKCVGDLADVVVELILANQGRQSGEIRLPCWQSHSPMTVAEFTQKLMQASNLPADHPNLQRATAKYRSDLLERFGL